MKSILAAAAFSLIALPAPAQEIVKWSDFIGPRQVMGALVQYGVVAIRTQTDFTYSGLSFDPAENRATIYDVVMRPQMGFSQRCQIKASRITVKGVRWSELTALRLSIGLSGLTLSPGCLPAEAGNVLNILQIREISVPQSSIDLRYDLPSGRAEVMVNSMVDSVGAVALQAQFEYLSLGPAEEYYGDPTLVANLSSARLQVEDAGAWLRLAPLIPAEFTDPAGAPTRVAQILRLQREQILGAQASTPGVAAYNAFVSSIEASLAGFFSNPSRLVVETGFDPISPVRLNFEAYGQDIAQMFADLQPIVGVQALAKRDLRQLTELATALQNPYQVPEATRRTLGLALLSGEGVPENRSAGLKLLSSLPESVDGSEAIVIARSLATDRPKEAYAAALRAAERGLAGASTLLDELEPRLSARDLFRLQAGLDTIASDAPETVSELRHRAAEHFDGKAGRSYVLAAYWARLAAAAGDGASDLLLDDIADRLTALGMAREWQVEDAKAADRALADWIELDIPARLAQDTR